MGGAGGGEFLADGAIVLLGMECAVLSHGKAKKQIEQRPRAGQQAGFVKTAVSTDDIKYIKADFTRDVNWFDWVNKIQFGLSYEDHLNEDHAHFYNTNVKSVGTLAAFGYQTTSPSLVSTR